MNILKDNGKYYFYNTLKIDKQLKPKNYLFNFDEFGNCWLEDIEGFKFPEKIYDVNHNLREMIKTSFNSGEKNLGVLLTGNKGQGKSLTAKLICSEANTPTIIINKQIPIDVNFIKFFNQIKQNYVLFVDEFEKLFNTTKNTNNKESSYHSQESFLSFIDGVFTNKHKILFLLTTNDNINEFFINRPSRIKFVQEYDELPEELFNMIVDDKLVNKEFKSDLEDNVSMINLNIDLLISIINDINLFNKPFSDFIGFYNYKFEFYKYEIYKINTNGNEVFEKFYNAEKKIKQNDRYIGDYKVKELLKFTKDEIRFTSIEYSYDKDDNEISTQITLKATPSKYITKNHII